VRRAFALLLFEERLEREAAMLRELLFALLRALPRLDAVRFFAEAAFFAAVERERDDDTERFAPVEGAFDEADARFAAVVRERVDAAFFAAVERERVDAAFFAPAFALERERVDAAFFAAVERERVEDALFFAPAALRERVDAAFFAAAERERVEDALFFAPAALRERVEDALFFAAPEREADALRAPPLRLRELFLPPSEALIDSGRPS
jgi:hypothetical protein